MGKHIVFVGAGHAHLTALARCREYVQRGHRVTVINPSPYQYYSGMGPGMLSGIYRPQDIRFNIRKMTEDRGAVFIQDAVTGINAGERQLLLKNGPNVQYDVVSFNTGSGVPSDGLNSLRPNVFPVKPIVNLLKARERVLETSLRKKARIVVIGGGPAGVEITGNVWRLVKEARGRADITLVSGRNLLDGFPAAVHRAIRSSFQSRSIQILEGARAETSIDGRVRLSDGTNIAFDISFLATGIKPSPLFADSGIRTGPTGGLLVNRHLRSIEHPEMFGGGDCIDFTDRSLAKVGVYAVRQNLILFHNILAAADGGEMRTFEPQRKYMLIFNLGDGTGLIVRDRLTWHGRLAFVVKDYIDRKFMRTFQLSGERDEEA